MGELENVQKGDMVILWPQGRYRPPEFLLVEHTTKTQIAVKGVRYLRSRGTRVGDKHDPWHRGPYLQGVTEQTRRAAEAAIAEAAIEARRRDAERTIRYARLELVPVDVLESVATLLRKAGAEA